MEAHGSESTTALDTFEQKYRELVEAIGYDSNAILAENKHDAVVNAAKSLSKIRTAFITSTPEKFPSIFITGITGEIDEFGMPEYLTVCPHYGMPGFALYRKDKQYTEPGW
jgi:hypothetical protein